MLKAQTCTCIKYKLKILNQTVVLLYLWTGMIEIRICTLILQTLELLKGVFMKTKQDFAIYLYAKCILNVCIFYYNNAL